MQSLINRKLAAFWQFSRPHTIIGTSLSVTALFVIAIAQVNSELKTGVLPNFQILIWALVACLGGNIYIVGLNQLFDIEIDKINKPNLPLASGEFSAQEGKLIIAICGVLALIIAATQGLFLGLTVAISLLIGTAYSMPPIRLKRFPTWASACIFTVRGVVVNLGLFLHFNQLINHNPNYLNIPSQVWGLTIFVLIYTYVIAIFKDMPDTEGDAQFNIMTLSISLGQVAVFNLSRQILASVYVGIIIASLTNLLTGVNVLIITASHLLLASSMWWRSLQVDLSDRTSITDFYQFIWKLFFLEYIIFPIACLLA